MMQRVLSVLHVKGGQAWLAPDLSTAQRYHPVSSEEMDDSEVGSCDEKIEQRQSSRQRPLWLRAKCIYIFVAIILLLGVYAAFNVYPRSDGIPSGELVDLPYALPDIYPSPASATNATMGFGKIYVINLKTRTDKRDELQLMAKATGLELEFHHPVPRTELDEKGLPPHGAWESIQGVGVTRAHMEMYEKIMAGPHETALILEDDADWDVEWPVALSRLSHAASTLLTSDNNDSNIRRPTEADPWSHQSWDVLFLGSCMEGFYEKNVPPGVNLDHVPIVSYLDPTVPAGEVWSSTFKDFYNNYNLSIATSETPRDERRRAIIRSAGAICTASYAVTKTGAAKMLWWSSRKLNLIDWAIADATKDGIINTYSVMPSLMSQWSLNKFSYSDKSSNEDSKSLAAKLNTSRLYDLADGRSMDRSNSTRANLQQLIRHMKE